MDDTIAEMLIQVVSEIRNLREEIGEMHKEQREMRTDIQHLGSQVNSLEKRVIDLNDTLKVVNYRVADVEVDVGKLKLK